MSKESLDFFQTFRFSKYGLMILFVRTINVVFKKKPYKYILRKIETK